MKQLITTLLILLSFGSYAQIANPYYLVAKRNTVGVEFIRLSWKADRRDLTVRNLVTFNGSSTIAGIGASPFDSSVVGRTSKYLDDFATTFTAYNYGTSGQSARSWIDYGANTDPVKNVEYVATYHYNNNATKEYPKIAIIQDASNWVDHGVANDINKEYIRHIAARFVQYGAQVIIVSPQPRTAYNSAQRLQLENFYFQLVGQYVTNTVQNVRFVKVYDTLVVQPQKHILPAVAQSDSIHLTNQGHGMLFKRIQSAIDSIYAVSTTILRHEIEQADGEFGPWTSYNNNVHPDTGFVNLPLALASKYFRVRTVYTNATTTAWSNIAISTSGLRTLTPLQFTENSQQNSFYRFLPDNYPEPGKKYPVIFFFHGIGERGNGGIGGELQKVLWKGLGKLLAGGATMEFTVNGVKERFIVLAPQLPESQGNWSNGWVDPIIKYAKENLQIDTGRMYMTGLSLGGGAVYTHITSSLYNASMWAAAAPVSASCTYATNCYVSDAKLPVWMFIDSNDPVVGTPCNRNWVTQVNSCAGNTVPVIERIYTGLGHTDAAWDSAYDTTISIQNPNMYQWFLTKSRSGSIPPVGKVLMGYLTEGFDDYNAPCSQSTYFQSVYGTDAVLSASDTLWTSATGSTYLNGQLRGWGFSPTGIGSPTHRIIFRGAPDNVNPHIHSIVECNPNTPPTCNAGGDKDITLPQNSAALQGSGSDAQGTVTYLWSKLSGPATYTISSTTAAAPTLTNLVAGTYVFRITVTDNQGATCTDDVTVLVRPVDPNDPIKIMPKVIIDIDGHNKDFGGSGFHARNWFTGFDSHSPRTNNMDAADTAGWYTQVVQNRPVRYPKDIAEPNGKAFYRGDRGLRLIFDMSNDKDMFKIAGARYKITDIYGLQQGGDGLDTMYFYKFDTVFTRPAHERYKLISRPDSLMKPFAKLVMKPANGIAYRPEWIGVTNLTDSMRYVMVIIKRKDRGGYSTWPTFSELVMYGTPLFEPASIIPKLFTYDGPKPVRLPANMVLGTNNVGIEMTQLQYDRSIRSYSASGTYDSDTTDYPNNKINLNPYGYDTAKWNAEYKIPKQQGWYQWESCYAGSKRLEVTGGGNVGKSIPVNNFMDEPEAPQSYLRNANYAYYYASFFGNNPNHTDAEFGNHLRPDRLPGYGHNYFSGYEPGNEDEYRGMTPLALVLHHNMTYDGYEGQFDSAGIKKGDSTMDYIMPATVTVDTSLYKAMFFLCKLVRTDQKVIYKIVNGHHYSRKYRDQSVLEHDPTYDEMWGTSGATPEWDDMPHMLNTVDNFIWRELDGDTSVRFALTEYGLENWVSLSRSVAEQVFSNTYGAFWTLGAVPVRPGGRDSLAEKGVIITRAESIHLTTRMRHSNEFMITNAFFNPAQNPGLFSSSGRGAADTNVILRNTLIPTKFKNYWARGSFFNMIGPYAVDSVYSLDSLGLCLIKWRHSTLPDSVCYEVWKGTWNNTTLSNVNINVGSTTTLTATKKTLNFIAATPGSSSVGISNGILSLATVEEEPAFYFVKEIITNSGPTIIKKTVRKPGSN